GAGPATVVRDGEDADPIRLDHVEEAEGEGSPHHLAPDAASHDARSLRVLEDPFDRVQDRGFESGTQLVRLARVAAEGLDVLGVSFLFEVDPIETEALGHARRPP